MARQRTPAALRDKRPKQGVSYRSVSVGVLVVAILVGCIMYKIRSGDDREKGRIFSAAMSLSSEGKWEDAIEMYEQAAQMGVMPSAFFLNEYGTALGEVGRIDEALIKFEEASQMDRTAFRALNNRATILTQRGEEFEDQTKGILLQIVDLGNNCDSRRMSTLESGVSDSEFRYCTRLAGDMEELQQVVLDAHRRLASMALRRKAREEANNSGRKSVSRDESITAEYHLKQALKISERPSFLLQLAQLQEERGSDRAADGYYRRCAAAAPPPPPDRTAGDRPKKRRAGGRKHGQTKGEGGSHSSSGEEGVQSGGGGDKKAGVEEPAEVVQERFVAATCHARRGSKLEATAEHEEERGVLQGLGGDDSSSQQQPGEGRKRLLLEALQEYSAAVELAPDHVFARTRLDALQG